MHNGDPALNSIMMKLLVQEPSEAALSKDGANSRVNTTVLLSQNNNVITQGRSEIEALAKAPNDDFHSDSSGSTSSLSSSDSDSSGSSSSSDSESDD